MTTGSILLGAALFILTALYVARPFLQAPAANARRSSQLNQLNHKETILEQIRQLEFDHETGKVPDDVYASQRQALVTEAAQVLQALDRSYQEDEVDSAIEDAIAARRVADAPVVSVKPAPRPVAAPVASSGQARGKFCPQCGQPSEPADNFCAFCGHQLASPAMDGQEQARVG